MADSAYPLQSAPGIRTVHVGGTQADALKKVLAMLAKQKHVRPIAWLDSEQAKIPEADAPGIDKCRQDLAAMLQGVDVRSAVHDRYDASRRNPYNEIECSDHYARAMASFGVFIAATGFHCHAPSGLLRFEPKIGAKDFAGPFIGAGAWGHFSQKQANTGLSATLDVRFGSMRLARLELTSPAGKATTSVTLAGKPVSHRVENHDGRLAIVLAQTLTLSRGQILEVRA